MKDPVRRATGKLALTLFALALILSMQAAALAQQDPLRRVYRAEETEPFPGDTVTLDLYVAPLLGADCLLLGSQGEWMLVDMGKDTDYPVVREMLHALGVERIALAFNTHPHRDHIGGMALIAAEFEVGRFITAFPLEYTGPSIRQLSTLSALKTAGIPIQSAADGDTFSFGGAQFKVLKVRSLDANASSAALHVRFGETSLLLGADIDALSQRKLAARYDLDADVLKYPHHGQEQLHQAFAEAVSPEFALFTHGSIGSVVGQKSLDRRGVGYLFATWGLIRLQSDGEKIIVSQDLSEEGLQYQKSWEKTRRR